MMKALYTAATGMNAQQTRLDNIANNLANVNTTAYKKQSASFEDLLYEEVGVAGGDEARGIQVGGGVTLAGTNRDHGAGALTSTGQPLDIAIRGEDGFFVLEAEDGNRYTRDGHFTLDSDGVLVSQSGLPLSGQLALPEEYDAIHVGEDGTISVTSGEYEEVIGQLELARFVNPGALEALGGNLYGATEASGQPDIMELRASGPTTLIQYHLEGSNVDIASELIGMIEAQRAYELTSKVVQAADENLQTAVNLKR
ncbi:MAG: flagellar basal-body rod protein FlgG [Proteobacteria bacterium]|nr:flagellar basal-body rod protein FlgG [Pseudomonadota bacterium]MCP4921727.1 flagellar basal-body rod protein FlgG [Pseudomonadota bacterium]